MKHIYTYIFCTLWCFPSLNLLAQNSWEAFVTDFQAQYQARDIAPLQLSYVTNLEAIPDSQELHKQQAFCMQSLDRLQSFSSAQLSPQQQLEHALLSYQLPLFQERLQLEMQWAKAKPKKVSEKGLATVPLGKEFYALFLKRWLDKEVTPDALFQFGMAEIQRIKARMKAIQEGSGMDSLTFDAYLNEAHFFYPDVATTQQALEAYAASIQERIPRYFPHTAEIPPLQIAEGIDKRLAQVPGFYRNNTFFYNFFDKPFNKRQVGWLYLHEGIPGHHYEVNHRTLVSQSTLQSLFYSPGYSEGWAAYIEDLALEIGVYRDVYDEYGKWEWDIIRSVRVPLDVGINYFGWTDAECLAFWRQYIQGQDDIARREIARMRRWPCQVITYKYGTRKILNWKKAWEQQADFSLLAFHTALLAHGPLPFSILEDIIRPNDHLSQK
ncbi:MAG: DUF885 domain-containing protein [Bacteroidota bacterium]